jgi:5-methylcytosine-specific restriction endonuclease McrA
MLNVTAAVRAAFVGLNRWTGPVGRKPAPLIPAVCAQCGRDFTHKPYEARRFCSRACFHAAGVGGQKRKARETVWCAACGTQFERLASCMAERKRTAEQLARRESHARNGDYCSRACYLAPRLSPDEARRRRRACTGRWRAANREHVQAYKREAYRRIGTADPETREYVAVIRLDPCVYCGGPTDTVDHIRPVSLGGPNHWTNLAPACRPCNSGKKDRRLLSYLLAKSA